jgi:uncharacterized membrane protein
MGYADLLRNVASWVLSDEIMIGTIVIPFFLVSFSTAFCLNINVSIMAHLQCIIQKVVCTCVAHHHAYCDIIKQCGPYLHNAVPVQ